MCDGEMKMREGRRRLGLPALAAALLALLATLALLVQSYGVLAGGAVFAAGLIYLAALFAPALIAWEEVQKSDALIRGDDDLVRARGDGGSAS